MSGRPRLVQEGEPITLANKTKSSTGGGNDCRHRHDKSLTMNHTVPVNAPHKVTHQKASNSSTNNAGGGGSSLQRAVRSSLTANPQYNASSLGNRNGRGTATTKMTTSFVIGSASVDAAHIGPPTKDHESPKSSTWSQDQPTTLSIERKKHFTVFSSSSDKKTDDHPTDTMMDDTHHDHSDLNESSSDMDAEPIQQGMSNNYLQHHAATISGAHGQIASSRTTSIGAATANATLTTNRTQMSCVIGIPHHEPSLLSQSVLSTVESDDRPLDRMEGVEDLGTKLPLVVLDGANVAYAYAAAMSGLDVASSLTAATVKNRPEPDVQGIKVATDYFLQSGLRVLVVLPQYWFASKPRPGDAYATASPKMDTNRLEILQDLKARGLIVASPPTDDDDAYALTIARREESRSLKLRQGEGPGFVVSNDLFRDAQDRDGGDVALKEWLKEGRHKSVGPGRISYTFGDMGTMNDRGERILDFVPNPRHPLIVWMETNNIVDGYATG